MLRQPMHGEHSFRSMIPGHGHVLPPEVPRDRHVHLPPEMSEGPGHALPHLEATSGHSGHVTRAGRVVHNVPMTGPRPQGTPAAGHQPGHIPSGKWMAPSGGHEAISGSRPQDMRGDGSFACRQEVPEPKHVTVSPEPQVAGQETWPMAVASRLTSWGNQDPQGNALDHPSRRPSGQCSHNATVESRLEREKIRTVVQSNTVG